MSQDLVLARAEEVFAHVKNSTKAILGLCFRILGLSILLASVAYPFYAIMPEFRGALNAVLLFLPGLCFAGPICNKVWQKYGKESKYLSALAAAIAKKHTAIHSFISRGDGFVVINVIDPHQAGASVTSNYYRSAAAGTLAALAAILHALAISTRRILVSTLYSTSSLRLLATA